MAQEPTRLLTTPLTSPISTQTDKSLSVDTPRKKVKEWIKKVEKKNDWLKKANEKVKQDLDAAVNNFITYI